MTYRCFKVYNKQNLMPVKKEKAANQMNYTYCTIKSQTKTDCS